MDLRNDMPFTLFFIFSIQNLIICQNDVDIQLIEEIAQKDAMEDINLFKYRESYYVPEGRILNFNKNYPDQVFQTYEKIYLESIYNYYNIELNVCNATLPFVLIIGCTVLVVYEFINSHGFLVSAPPLYSN